MITGDGVSQIWNPASDKKKVKIGSLNVLILESNNCAHIYDQDRK